MKKVTEFYGKKYDFSLVKYRNSNTPVTIECKKHGFFEQTPILFLKNHESGYEPCTQCRLNLS